MSILQKMDSSEAIDQKSVAEATLCLLKTVMLTQK